MSGQNGVVEAERNLQESLPSRSTAAQSEQHMKTGTFSRDPYEKRDVAPATVGFTDAQKCFTSCGLS